MVPRELDGKTPWPQPKANVKLQEIRAKVIEEFCDEDRANGIPVPGKCHEVDNDGNITINPMWSMMQHVGVRMATETQPADGTNVRTVERWRRFARSPMIRS